MIANPHSTASVLQDLSDNWQNQQNTFRRSQIAGSMFAYRAIFDIYGVFMCGCEWDVLVMGSKGGRYTYSPTPV